MKAFKNIKNPHPDNLYVNIILLLFFLIVGVCVVRACKSAELSAENLETGQTFATFSVDETCFDISYQLP